MTTEDTTVNMLETALQYVRQGWSVFPLSGKSPLKGSNGFKDASTSTAAVYDWWSDDETYNIGLAIAADIVVIDVDPRNGGLEAAAKLQADHGWLPQTKCAVSGRGDGGLHYYYRVPTDTDLVGNLNRAGYPGIDLKKQGGYVVLPPSVHPETGRSYRWVDADCGIADMPAWLIELAARPPVVTAPVRPVATGTIMDRLDMPDTTRWNGDGLVDAVAAAKPGERNNILNWSLWSLKDDTMAGKVSDDAFNKTLALIIDTATKIGLDDREIKSTLNSVFRTGE